VRLKAFSVFSFSYEKFLEKMENFSPTKRTLIVFPFLEESRFENFENPELYFSFLKLLWIAVVGSDGEDGRWICWLE
jgi:hypothetical protein